MSEAQKILQTGLYTTDPEEVKKMANRVDKFNLNHIGQAIKLDCIPFDEGDRICDGPHVKFRFLFPSRAIQRQFWTE